MKPDDFEQQLRRQPLGPVPKEWRAGILQAARAEARPPRSTPNPQSTPWWREWLWPCPQAWAGLATVWIIILGLNTTAPKPSGFAAGQPAASTPEAQMTLAAQRRELARLLETFAEPAPAPRPAPTSPRSEGNPPSKA